ncbi:hypothetical protein GVAV_000237 [Gurleya vavrai]
MSNDNTKYTSIREYKIKMTPELSIKILTDPRYPNFLVPLAFEHLKTLNKKIPINYIELEGIRRKYLIQLYLINKENFFFSSIDYIFEIIMYYQNNPLDDFLLSNLVRYTKNFLNYNNLKQFISLWNLLKDQKERYFKKYIEKLSINNLIKNFIKSIIYDINFFNFARFFIANEIEVFDYNFHPIHQLRILVRFLKTEDIIEKQNLLENKFLFCFENVLKCNLELFDIDKKIKILTYEEYNNKIIGYNKNAINDLLKETTENFVLKDFVESLPLSDYDTLEIRMILYFFKFNNVNEDWHNYFIKSEKIQNFDGFFIKYYIFNELDYSLSFTKKEHKILDDFNNINFEKSSLENLINLYFISNKNPKYKNILKNELENFFEDKIIINKKNKLKNICHDPDDNINIIENFDVNYFLYKSLTRIGAINFTAIFDFYHKKNLLLFFSVLYFYIKNCMLDYEAYENFILEFYNEKEKELKVSENNDEKLLFAILFELKNFQKETKIEEIIEVFEILNPNIIKRFEIKNVVESFESILTAVKFFIKARLKSINNNLNVLQPDNYKKILVFDLFEVTVENFLFDAAYSD